MNFYLDEFYPECVYHNLNRLLDKPVYITENGCSCYDDDFRIVYLAEYLSAMNEAIKSGVDLRGYLYWSFLDNYEWSTNIPKFGLVEVENSQNCRYILSCCVIDSGNCSDIFPKRCGNGKYRRQQAFVYQKIGNSQFQ